MAMTEESKKKEPKTLPPENGTAALPAGSPESMTIASADSPESARVELRPLDLKALFADETPQYRYPEDIDPGVFRKELMTLFPKYMIPVKYIRKDLLPRNTNGKIDRNLLSEEVNANE